MNKSSFADFYRKHTPMLIRYYIGELRTYGAKKKAFSQFLSIIGSFDSYDCKDEIQYIVNKGEYRTFPYKWTEDYFENDIIVKYDKNEHLRYALVKGKKLYFPKSYSEKYIKKYVNAMCIEQDPRSPHYYFDTKSEIFNGATFVDVGAAEGLISLSIIDSVDKVYLFECDDGWIKALQATFRPYQEKVTIIKKWCSDKSDDKYIRLDDVPELLNHQERLVIKMDVEGMEKHVLNGAAKILRTTNIDAYVCSYHKKEDEVELADILRENGFQIEYTKGYMLCGVDTQDLGFRKGVIRAHK